MEYLVFAAGLAALLTTLLPLIPSGKWWIRILDFPRLHILCIALFALVAKFLLEGTGTSPHLSITAVLFLLSQVAVLLYQGFCIFPFLPVFQTEVPSASQKQLNSGLSRIRILIANVKFKNGNYQRFREIARMKDVDLILLTEVTQLWERALEAFLSDFPFRLSELRDDGHGIGLYSKVPFRNEKIRFLVSKDRPSVFATLILSAGCEVNLWGLHPAPPAIKMENGERKDSRPRDAELILVAKEMQNYTIPGLVLGDFNDAAWSATTKLFKEISGMADPRVGRGLYNTYHAEHPLMRYPIDHVFASGHFALSELSRLPGFGSDHFPIYADFVVHNESVSSEKEKLLVAEANNQASEIVREGKKQAEQYSQQQENPPS